MVVNATVVNDVITIFRTLYEERFPIKRWSLRTPTMGTTTAAASADDTSGFNCRYAVAPGPPQWSVHAYGEAIDVNDVQNPYVDGSTIIPPAGAPYLDRADVRPGMAVPGGQLVEAFASVGWYWGGRWTGFARLPAFLPHRRLMLRLRSTESEVVGLHARGEAIVNWPLSRV